MNQESDIAPGSREHLAEDRTRMARFRTQLALDRTTLAWVRTTLTMATFGFGLVGFFRSLRQSNPNPETIRLHEGAIFFGTSLIVLGLAATIIAGLLHVVTLRRLRQGRAPVMGVWPLSVTVGMLLAIAGLAGLWVLVVH